MRVPRRSLFLALLAYAALPQSSVHAQLTGCPARYIRVNNTPGINGFNFVRAMSSRALSPLLIRQTS